MVLAHQGGWDEVLLVLLPIALFGGLLYVANKRAGRLADDEDETESEEHEA
jgi:hypothetical protein